jgi:hypothetical protein
LKSKDKKDKKAFVFSVLMLYYRLVYSRVEVAVAAKDLVGFKDSRVRVKRKDIRV